MRRAAKWRELGGINGYGYPITDELPADRGGRFNDFDRGNSIYSHPAHGTHAVYGFIRVKWRSLGAERSFLGYPVTDELSAANLGRFSAFAGGLIFWHPNVGAYAIYGEIGKRWLQLGAERSSCGYPTSDEADFDDGRDGSVYGYGTGKRFRRSTFVRGQILWSKARNQVYVECNQQTSQPPPAGEACNFTAIATNNKCLNADSTPSSLPSGGTTGTGCGSDIARAQARAKLVLVQATCLTEGNTPQPGCCTFSLQTAAGCSCR
jgi:LGFP repeat